METKKQRKRTPRLCPACKPGIYCAACLGRGHSPQARIIPPPGFGGRWTWPGVGERGYTVFNAYFAPLRIGERNRHTVEKVPNSQGSAASATRTRMRRRPSPAATAFLREGGWIPVRTKDGRAAAGITAHRGILHPDEYVDWEDVVRRVEQELGCTTTEAVEVYGRGPGPLPTALQTRRAELDKRLASVDNLAVLARLLGVPERTLQRAARRGQRN